MPKGIHKRVLPPWNKKGEVKTGERCAKCGSYYHKTDSHLQYRNSIALKYRQRNREKLRGIAIDFYDKEKEHLKLKRDNLKFEVLKHYGNGKLQCTRCGYSDTRALSIDHTEGNGTRHREEIGYNLYRWLKKNNFPEGFTTLCLNCQWLKRQEKWEYGGKRIRV